MEKRNLLIIIGVIVVGILGIGIYSVLALIAPSHNRPGPDATIQVRDVYFDWNSVDGADCYLLEVLRRPSGEQHGIWPSNTTGFMPSPFPDTCTNSSPCDYQWHVKACENPDCTETSCFHASLWSEAWDFTIAVPPEPTNFNLISPGPDTIVDTQTPIFTYSGNGVGCFEMYVMESDGVTVVYNTSTAETSFSIPPEAELTDGGIYTWYGLACAQSCDQDLVTCVIPENVGADGYWTFTVEVGAVPPPPPRECPASLTLENPRKYQENSDDIYYTGLVPCGKCVLRNPTITDSTATGRPEYISCQFCHFFVMLDGILDFILFTLVPIIAVLIIVIGGAMYMFAHFGGAEMLPGGARGGPAMLSQAKRVITSVVIGVVIIYGAWLIINLFLTIIGFADWTGLGEWFQFPCP